MTIDANSYVSVAGGCAQRHCGREGIVVKQKSDRAVYVITLFLLQPRTTGTNYVAVRLPLRFAFGLVEHVFLPGLVCRPGTDQGGAHCVGLFHQGEVLPNAALLLSCSPWANDRG